MISSDTALWRHYQVERKTISIMKACDLVGVSRRTIYNWLSSGKIEYVRTAGGSVRIFADTLWRDPQRSGRQAADRQWRPEEQNQF
jgi:excisionase family DNA binding protein